MLAVSNLTSLSSHRDDLTHKFFFSTLPILHPVYIISFPHPNLMQLHLDVDHTKFTLDHLPAQIVTVLSYNMAFLITRSWLLPAISF